MHLRISEQLTDQTYAVVNLLFHGSILGMESKADTKTIRTRMRILFNVELGCHITRDRESESERERERERETGVVNCGFATTLPMRDQLLNRGHSRADPHKGLPSPARNADATRMPRISLKTGTLGVLQQARHHPHASDLCLSR